jgi:hypothetical protein
MRLVDVAHYLGVTKQRAHQLVDASLPSPRDDDP